MRLLGGAAQLRGWIAGVRFLVQLMSGRNWIDVARLSKLLEDVEILLL
jgi:hypothetical protein